MNLAKANIFAIGAHEDKERRRVDSQGDFWDSQNKNMLPRRDTVQSELHLGSSTSPTNDPHSVLEILGVIAPREKVSTRIADIKDAAFRAGMPFKRAAHALKAHIAGIRSLRSTTVGCIK